MAGQGGIWDRALGYVSGLWRYGQWVCLLFNWNLLDDGAPTVMNAADGEEVGRATVEATTLRAGAEKECLRGAEGAWGAQDCPRPAAPGTGEGAQKNRNGVRTDREQGAPAAKPGRPVE